VDAMTTMPRDRGNTKEFFKFLTRTQLLVCPEVFVLHGILFRKGILHLAGDQVFVDVPLTRSGHEKEEKRKEEMRIGFRTLGGKRMGATLMEIKQVSKSVDIFSEILSKKRFH
jgi:hypothetical protein